MRSSFEHDAAEIILIFKFDEAVAFFLLQQNHEGRFGWVLTEILLIAALPLVERRVKGTEETFLVGRRFSSYLLGYLNYSTGS